MIFQRPFATVIAILSLTTFASAQDKLLPPTFQTGKKYELEMKSEVTMDMTAVNEAMGLDGVGAKTQVDIIMTMISIGEKHSVAGQRKMTTTYSHVAMNMNMGAVDMKYDSNDPDSASSPIAMAIKPLLSTEFVMIYDENDKLLDVQGLDTMKGLQQFDKKQLMQMLNPSGQIGIPAEGVSIGDTWETISELAMGKQMGELKMKMTSKYEKDEVIDGVKCATVTYTASLEDAEGTAADVPIMSLSDFEMTGSMSFDKVNRMIKTGEITAIMTSLMPSPKNPEEKLSLPLSMKQTYTMKSVTDL